MASLTAAAANAGLRQLLQFPPAATAAQLVRINSGSFQLSSSLAHSSNQQQRRGLRREMLTHREPPVHRSQPDNYRLPFLPKVPVDQQTALVNWPKGTKDLRRFVGEEEIHDKLILGQYAIVAVSGGAMQWRHYHAIAQKINRYLDPEKSFGIMRFDPPYKPVTSKSGKRMGGGKGKVKAYSTTIKAGRVIVEIAGKIGWDEVQPWLTGIATRLPFNAIAVDQALLNRLNSEEDRLQRANQNPMTLEWFIRNNIMDCQRHMSPYDIKLMGKFTYKDMTNQRKWSLALQEPYRRPGSTYIK